MINQEVFNSYINYSLKFSLKYLHCVIIVGKSGVVQTGWDCLWVPFQSDLFNILMPGFPRVCFRLGLIEIFVPVTVYVV